MSNRTRAPSAPILAADRPLEAEPSLAGGWMTVAGAFIVTMVGYGAIYSYAAFAEEIAAEFAVGRASVAVIFALSGGACFFVSALSGPLADRIGARPMAAIGMLAVAFGLVLAATATSLAEVYVGYGLLIGLGTGFAYVPAIAAVQRWFVAHRGLASGLAVSGIGVGTVLVPPLADWLSSLGSWRSGFVAFGGLAAVVGLAGAAMLLPPPGPGPRSDPPTATPRDRLLLLAYGGTLLVSLPATLPHALLVSTARDMGLERAEAVALLGLIGLGTIVGRFLLAVVADLVGRRTVFLACCWGMAASMLAWAFAGDMLSLRIFALAFGALQGGFVALLPAFVADRFGARGLGGVLGLLYTSRGIALVAGPPAVGWAFALLDGHEPPLVVVALFGAVGCALLAAAGRRSS
jgi:MFS transporter, OFA family, oxalate/formate antiporter